MPISTSHTSLTVGGFIQPSMAKALIEMAQNIEKGLCQQFLWLAPKPVTVAFDDLEQVDSQFSASVGKKICSIGNETGKAMHMTIKILTSLHSAVLHYCMENG